MKTETLLPVCINVLIQFFMGSCTYSINMPDDISCEKVTALPDDQYLLENCRCHSRFGTIRYNLLLTVREERGVGN